MGAYDEHGRVNGADNAPADPVTDPYLQERLVLEKMDFIHNIGGVAVTVKMFATVATLILIVSTPAIVWRIWEWGF
jgi:hypothetical protein